MAALSACAGKAVTFKLESLDTGCILSYIWPIVDFAERTALWIELSALGVFIVSIYPAYYLFCAIYAKGNEFAQGDEVRVSVKQYIFVTAGCGVFAAGVLIGLSSSGLLPDLGELWSQYGATGIRRLFFLALPFHAMAITLLMRVRNKKYSVLWFRHRTFFPALLTCSISFISGWYIGPESSEHQGWTWTIALALWLVLWVATTWRDAGGGTTKLLRWGIVVTLLVLVLAPLVSYLDPSGAWVDVSEGLWVLFFGVLLALGMGVCEASRVTARVLHDEQLVPDGDRPMQVNINSEDVKNLYEIGLNSASAFSLPLFLMTALFRGLNLLYPVGIFVITVGYFLLWVAGTSREGKKGFHQVVSRLLGFWTLLVVLLGVAVPEPFVSAVVPFLMKFLGSLQFLPPFALLVFSLKMLRHFEEKHVLMGKFIQNFDFRTLPYSDKEACVALSIIAAGFFSVFWFGASLASLFFTNAATRDLPTGNASEFEIACSLVMCFLLLYQLIGWVASMYFVGRSLSSREPKPEPEST